MAYGAAIVGLIGVGISGYGMYAQGESSADQAKRNQQLLNQTAYDNRMIALANVNLANKEANSIEGVGLDAVAMKRKEIARLLAYQRVTEAAAGFRYSGTPLLVAEQSEREGELDVSTIWSNALREANMVREKGKIIGMQGDRSAEQMRIQGDIMASAGSYAQTAGLINTGSTLLSGVSNAYMASQGYQKNRYGNAG